VRQAVSLLSPFSARRRRETDGGLTRRCGVVRACDYIAGWCGRQGDYERKSKNESFLIFLIIPFRNLDMSFIIGVSQTRSAHMKQLKRNDKVKDIYGDWHTVYEVRGNIIYTLNGSHVHITKVIKVK
jgi:hypothetical protein